MQLLLKKQNYPKDSEKALKAFIDVVTDELVKGEKVQLVGLVHLKYPKDLQEKAETHRQAKQCRSLLPRLRNSKPEKALKDVVNA